MRVLSNDILSYEDMMQLLYEGEGLRATWTNQDGRHTEPKVFLSEPMFDRLIMGAAIGKISNLQFFAVTRD